MACTFFTRVLNLVKANDKDYFQLNLSSIEREINSILNSYAKNS